MYLQIVRANIYRNVWELVKRTYVLILKLKRLLTCISQVIFINPMVLVCLVFMILFMMLIKSNQLDLSIYNFSTILGNPGATSWDDAITSGERYFRAKVYRAYSYRASSRSGRIPFRWLGIFFLPNQRGALAGWICRLLTRSSFLHRSTKLLGLYNGKIVAESFRKKYTTKPRKSQALT